ncbi:MAG: response regulator [Planctomycetes bacterium]|nr:response regulator [Planctomycetota bacterium]
MVEKRTVLFVDDDEIILRSIKRAFLDELFDPLYANSGSEALEILQKEQVHVIVTDMLMPGMDGIELLKIVRERHPHIVKIVLSGYMDISALQEEFKQGEIFKIVPKPWKIEEGLKQVVLKAIEHYNLQSQRDVVMQKN